jgi:amino acid adenylation domain-containing protein
VASSSPIVSGDCLLKSSQLADDIVERIRHRAASQASKIAYVFIGDGHEEAHHLTYGDLDSQARAVAAHLQMAANPGARVLLLYPSSLDYVVAFYGCLYAGCIAVPAYPPQKTKGGRNDRLAAIISSAQPAVILTTTMQHKDLRNIGDSAAEVIFTDRVTPEDSAGWKSLSLNPQSPALLQYTSGSVSAPKGVILTHANLAANQHMIQWAFKQDESSVVVSWLPLYHDMGLIGTVLQPAFSGSCCILLSPTSFLQRPSCWLRAISNNRATTSGAPDFAYDLCTRKIGSHELADLDLSHWKVAFSGAEPVRASTLDHFAEKFAPCGFRPEAFYPCYGLAEATLVVTGGKRAEAPPRVVQPKASNRGKTSTRPMAPAVSCGLTVPGQRVLIVDPERRIQCRPGVSGEIWTTGANVAAGYWGNDAETKRTFGAHLAHEPEQQFLRTGDLGFIDDGELFITGRLKDLIIIRGENYHPEDIELTAEHAHPDLRPHGSIAFSIPTEAGESLVVVHELVNRKTAQKEKAADAVRAVVAEQHGLLVHTVALIKLGALPRTTSGKRQRSACREKFLKGALKIIFESTVAVPGNVVPVASMDVPVPGNKPFESRRDELEQYLRASIAKLTQRSPESIDVQAPLSALGIDSLASLELKNQIEAELRTNITVSHLLEGVSIASLAAELAEDHFTAVEGIGSKRDQHAPFPLSHGQRSLWFHYRLTPQSAAYNLARALKITGQLDVAALHRCFTHVLDRHAALRTTFFDTAEGPRQRVTDRAEAMMTELDATGWNQAELQSRLLEYAERPFDLEHGPLLRLVLARVSESQHVLQLATHHIVADFWSVGLLLDELTTLYRAENLSINPALPQLRLSYAGWVDEEEKVLSGPEGERLWQYWRAQLHGQSGPPDLPYDYPHPPVSSGRGEAVSFFLGPLVTESLKKLAKEQNATLFMVLLAGLQALLHRYSAGQRIPVAAPVNLRGRAGLERVVGYLVNPVIFNADCSEDPTFGMFVDQVRGIVLHGLENQDLPISLLIERLAPVREGGRQPLFDVMLTFQPRRLLTAAYDGAFIMGQSSTPHHMCGLDLQCEPLQQTTAQFDLNVTVVEAGSGISGSFIYNSDVFERGTIERMASHWETLLGGAAQSPQHRLSELVLLSEAEQKVFAAANQTARDYGCELLLAQLLEAQTHSTASALAVISSAGALTYDDLNRKANQVAHWLLKQGACADTLVGLLMERSLEMVIGILGVLKAGAAYIPLDPEYPRHQLQLMLSEAKPVAVLTQNRWSKLLPFSEMPILELDTAEETLASMSTENPLVVLDPLNLAYVIYTSGSTGRPKGAMNTLAGISNRLLWMQQEYGLTGADRIFQKTPYTFDVSVWEFLWPLMTGAAVVMAAPGEHRDSASLARTIARREITTMHFVPSMLRVFLEEKDLPQCKSLRRVICSGEELSCDLVERFHAVFPEVELHNLYGPTEASIDVTSHKCERKLQGRAVSIGVPINNTQVHVLDSNLKAQPIGIAGELYIGGSCLARGYLAQPDLTAERFIPNPFGNSGERLYKTGDRAKWDSGGNLQFSGRVDHQVKVRGFRVELEEIESVLHGHAAIRQAAVAARDDGRGGKRLVAFIVTDSSDAIDAELRHLLQEKLPPFMAAVQIVHLDSMPLTSSGKLDRKALQQIPERRISTSALPQTDTEQVLAKIWAELLGISIPSIHEDFFQLGGHSLLALQLLSRVRERFDIEIPLRDFFKGAFTVAELARVVEEAEIQQADAVEIAAILEELNATS